MDSVPFEFNISLAIAETVCQSNSSETQHRMSWNFVNKKDMMSWCASSQEFLFFYFHENLAQIDTRFVIIKNSTDMLFQHSPSVANE